MGRMSKAIEEYQKIEKNSRFIFKNYYEIIDMSTSNVEMVRNACQAAYIIGFNDAKKSTLASINGNDAPGTKAKQ